MKKMLKSLCFGALLMALGLGTVTGCSEEERGDADKPFIFEQIEILYGLVGNGTAASKDFAAQLTSYSRGYSSALTLACEDYNEDLKAVKNDPITLATKQRNSGFYTSLYILLSDMEKKAASSQSNKQFSKLFTDAGCKTLLSDAKKVVTERDNKTLKL